MTKKIVAIWAQDEQGLIGKNQRLPWYLPAELQHFKETTLNHAIVMGRVTFDGMKKRVLPKRTTLVLTHDKTYRVDHPDVLLFQTIEEVLEWYQKQEKTLYIIGGRQIFSQFEPYLDEIIRTTVHVELEGDTYFPEAFRLTAFEVASQQFFKKDEQNEYDFTVERFKRKGS